MAKVNFLRLSVLFFLFSFVLASSQKLIFKYGNFSHNELELTFRVEKMCKKVVSFCHSNLACLLSPPSNLKKTETQIKYLPRFIACSTSIIRIPNEPQGCKQVPLIRFLLTSWVHTYLSSNLKTSISPKRRFFVGPFLFLSWKKISRQFSGGFALLTLSLCIPCGVLWHERPPNWKLRKYVRDTPSLMSSGFAADFH